MSAFWTRSWSPTEAPPRVTKTSTSRVERLADRGVEGAEVVAGDAEVDRDAAAGLDDPGYGEIIRCDDLRGAERLAGRDQLVARRQDRDARGTSDRQRDVIGRRSQRDVAGGQPAAGGKQKLALGEIESGRAQIVADGRGAGKRDPVALALRLFLNDDGVGAARDGRAGEDANGFARADFAVEGASRRRLADHAERNGRACRIGGAERIAVHGRIDERRLGAQRDHVVRQHPAEGFFERDPLAAERRRGRSQHARERLFDRDQRAHGFGSSARHSPDLPPRFSISRTPSTLMPRSIALAMS